MRHALLLSAALVFLAACPEGCQDVTVTWLCNGDQECQNDELCDGRERCDRSHPRANENGCVAPAVGCSRCLNTAEPTPAAYAERERDFQAVCAGEVAFFEDVDCTDPVTFGMLCWQGDLCETDDDCDDGVFCNGGEVCDPSNLDSRGRGCLAGPGPCAPETEFCSEAEQSCITLCPLPDDADGDGSIAIGCGGDDCDDEDDTRAPGNPEVCDFEGHDEDCDPTTFGRRDRDGDGFTDVICENVEGGVVTSKGTDCNDTNVLVHPAAQELCNGFDDNCDGAIDDSVSVLLYPDTDHDGYGAPVAPVIGCLDDLDMSLYAGDCDDNNEQIFPGSIRCIPGGQGYEIEICQDDGTWLEKVCDGFTACVTQPGGHGVCQ